MSGVLALVGGAVYCLAIAPKPKSEPATPSLFEISLTDSGITATGCPKQFEALKLGGSDDEPIVAVIGSTCTKGSVPQALDEGQGQTRGDDRQELRR